MRSLFMCAALLAAPAANAALVTYDYVGAEYDYYADGVGVEDFDDRWLSASQNHVSGWITLDTDMLGGSINNVTYAGGYMDPVECGDDPETECPPTPLHSWSFFDGVTINGVPGENEFVLSSDIRFSTDGAGNIVSWDFFFDADPDALVLSSRRGDVRAEGACGGMEIDIACARSSVAGTWTRRDATPVPEPSAFALMAAVLGGLAFIRRKELKATLLG